MLVFVYGQNNIIIFKMDVVNKFFSQLTSPKIIEDLATEIILEFQTIHFVNNIQTMIYNENT